MDVTVELRPGESPFTAAAREHLLIPTACAGKGTCGLCRVKVTAGAEHLGAPSAVEVKHLGNTYFITKLRLSCQLAPAGDVTLTIPNAPTEPKPR
jgi:ferredoxin